MTRFASAKYLQPYMSERLKQALNEPIEFAIHGGLPSPLGYEAFVLPELCNAVLDAERAGALQPQQLKMAEQARILSRAFAVVGIVALVDEATGYQEIRDRHALHDILKRYIRDALGEWAKRFPDEFYEQLFRLRGWQYKGMSVGKPSYVGKLTNDLVYSRLAPGVLAELRRRVPRDEEGRLKHHYRRLLTDDIGPPALQGHLHGVVALMRASTDWRRFMSLMARAYPKFGTTLPLPPEFPEDDE